VGWLMVAAGGSANEPVFNGSGFRIPTPHPAFSFPRDHGSHPEFRIEWWYITGHLRDDEEQRFGFQATFFRVALTPQDDGAERAVFGTNQLMMAHMALADPVARSFVHEERLNREGWDAWARVDGLDLRNGNWSLQMAEDGAMTLVGSVRSEVSFSLRLAPLKGPVFFGKGGLSRKGASESAASWYITFPRLHVTGHLDTAGATRQVVGEAWMDHEISSSQLEEEQVGWDWASLRLHDGREVMVYILRHRDGSVDPFSTLAWIDESGGVHHFSPDQFSWTSRRTWESPVTGGRYPLDIVLTAPRHDGRGEEKFLLRPLMDAQEMVGHLGGVSYWEGACDVLDSDGAVVGEAYVELTGYAEELTDALR
jgi:predicted secreted hydrolase